MINPDTVDGIIK